MDVALEQLTPGDKRGTCGRHGLTIIHVVLIAGDVGGTNTRLGLFARDAARPRSVLTREYESQRYATFEEILSAFVADLGGVSVDAAAIGVAGPILQQTARLTNIDWEVSASGISALKPFPRAGRFSIFLFALGPHVSILHNCGGAPPPPPVPSRP